MIDFKNCVWTLSCRTNGFVYVLLLLMLSQQQIWSFCQVMQRLNDGLVAGLLQEEFEDSAGNVVTKKIYEDLRRQGLLWTQCNMLFWCIASETVSRDRRSVCGWLECEPLTWSLVLAPVAAKQDAKNYGEFAACWRDGSQCLVAIGFLSHLVKKKLILKTITFRTGVYGVPWQIVPVNLFFSTYAITFHQHYRQTW